MNHSSIALARYFLHHFLSDDAVSPKVIDAMIALGVDWLQTQGLAPSVWHKLRSAQRLNLPIDLVSDLRGVYYAAIGGTELHRQELIEVLQILAEQATSPVVFKGAALAYTVYPDPVCRPMGDLDLWVTAEELPRAQAALDRIGYIPSIKPDRPIKLMTQNYGEVQMQCDRPGHGLIELHLGVFTGEWLRWTAAIDHLGIRARAVSVVLAGESALTLAAEDGVIQLAVHAAVNHQMGFAGLRSLIDIALLARSATLAWEVVVDRARTWRVATATWLVLKLAIDLLGLNEATAAMTRLRPSPVRRWLIGRLVNANTIVRLRDLRMSRLRFVFLLLLIDRKRDMARLMWRALRPNSDWLVARYGHSGLNVGLRHFANALRGRL